MHRQPQARLTAGGPADPVPAVGRNFQPVARIQGDFTAVGEHQAGGPAQQHHPFVLGLVVPFVRRRGLAVGNNPLDAHAGTLGQQFKYLILRLGCQELEKITAFQACHGCRFGKIGFFQE